MNVENGEKIELDYDLHGTKRVARFPVLYWRTFVTLVVPLIYSPIFLQNNIPMFRCLYLICIMGTFWVTECIDSQITALLPLFLFPFMGIMDTNQTSMQYMKAANFMFVGGIILANAIEYSSLHTRIAYFAVAHAGCSLRKLNFILMLITMLVSMWIPNTAATAMMCPIAKAILKELEKLGMLKVYYPAKSKHDRPLPTDVTLCFYLGLAYAATIGGCGTFIGTPTNLIFKQIFQSRFEDAPPVNFLNFMLFSAPVSYVCTFLTFIWLQFLYLGLFRPNSDAAAICNITPEAKIHVVDAVKNKYKDLGKISSHEIWVGIVFITTIILICTKSPGFVTGWADYLEISVGETSVCILGVFFLFLIPSKWTCFRFFKNDGIDSLPIDASKPLLIWAVIHRKTPWSLIFLLGGGFALSEGAKVSGVSIWLGEQLKAIGSMPHLLILFVSGVGSEIFSNLTSNVAVANIILPVAAEMAIAIKVHPMYIMMPVAIGCSFVFCLPVGTPPNAIIAGLVNIKTPDMIRCGIGPSIICLVLYISAFPTYGALIFPQYQTFPEWAKNKTGGS